MASRRAERQILIRGAPQECFAAVVDYDSFPEWQRAVRSCEVLERDRNGRGERVAFEVDAKIDLIHYTLDYHYEEPHLVAWRFVAGDVRDVDGELVLEDTGEGATLATYALRMGPGGRLPARLSDLLSGQLMEGVLEDLKQRVEGAPA